VAEKPIPRLEAIQLCADAMDKAWVIHKGSGAKYYDPHYNPLQNDAQAFALQERFELCILKVPGRPYTVWRHNEFHMGSGSNADLKAAIVECVARLEQNRQTNSRVKDDPRITNHQVPQGVDLFGPEMAKEYAKVISGSQT
jgi:hypothetical protein